MALNFKNELNIDIDVHFSYNGNRRGAFPGNDSSISKNGNKELDLSGISRGMEFELHIELTQIPFQNKVKGVRVKPGSLGVAKRTTFDLFQLENADENVVYTIVIKLERPGSEIGDDEPQVLHPEDKPIIPSDGG